NRRSQFFSALERGGSTPLWICVVALPESKAVSSRRTPRISKNLPVRLATPLGTLAATLERLLFFFASPMFSWYKGLAARPGPLDGAVCGLLSLSGRRPTAAPPTFPRNALSLGERQW